MGQKRAHVTFARLAMSRSASLFSYFTTLDDVRVYRGVCYSEAGLIQTPECQTPMLSATFDNPASPLAATLDGQPITLTVP